MDALSMCFTRIGVPKILQCGGSCGVGPAQGAWGMKSPEAEAKCEISVHFLTFSCIKIWI